MTRFSASASKTSLVTAGLALALFAAANSIPTRAQSSTDVPKEAPSQAASQDTSQEASQDTGQDASPASVSVSKVRIVRVSEVRGAVQLDRSNGHGYEPAIANLPVVETNRLKTDAGVAEVEFEDNSTLRLGINSEVEFTELGRTATGSTLSSVRVLRGVAYVSLLKPGGKQANEFNLSFGDRTIPLQAGTHVRLIMPHGEPDPVAKLTVVSGTLRLDSPNGAVEVPRKKMAAFSLTGQGEPVVGKNEDSGPLDDWDKQNTQYHERVANMTAFGNVPYSYGLADMMYYGAFTNMGGCGMMWRPYFASAAWDPYSSGSWAYYTGAGFSWVSPYPWGWTPYHYGSWNYCPGSGWGWMPGGSWMGIRNTVFTTTSAPGSGAIPRQKPRLPVAPTPPRPGQPTLLHLNQSTLVRSGVDAREGAFVFRKDSAGMGVPRGELGGLKGFSNHAMQHGMAATPVYAAGGDSPRGPGGIASGAIRGGPGNTTGVAPVAIHRGSAPISAPSMGGGNFGGRGPSGGFGGGGMRAPTSMAPAPVARPSAPAAGPHH